MKLNAVITFIAIVGFLISGCGVNNAEIKLEEPLYHWDFVGRLSNKEIRDIRVADDGTIIVPTKNRIYFSEDNGDYFRGFAIPDSVDTYRVRKYENDYFLIGQMYSRYASGDWGGTIRILYVMRDGEQVWEKIHGGYLFQDVLVKEDQYFVGALNGVTVVGPDYITKERFTLFNSRLNDQVDDMIEFHDYLLLSSHEGVFGSKDMGSTWLDLTARLNKQHDHILKMRIDEQGTLHAMAKHRSYIAQDDQLEWSIRYLPDRYDVVNMKSHDEYLAIDYNRVYQLKFDEGGSAKQYSITPEVYREVEYRYWNFIESLPEGKVLLAGTEGVFLGTPNPESEYWK